MTKRNPNYTGVQGHGSDIMTSKKLPSWESDHHNRESLCTLREQDKIRTNTSISGATYFLEKA